MGGLLGRDNPLGSAFEPSEYHLAEIRKHNYEVSLRRRQKLNS